MLSTTVVVQSSRPQPEVSLRCCKLLCFACAHNVVLNNSFHSPSDPTRGDGGGSQMVVIIGSALGAAVLVLILMVTVVVGCLIWRRKRRKRESPHQSAHQSAQPSTVVGSNPVYEGTRHVTVLLCFHLSKFSKVTKILGTKMVFQSKNVSVGIYLVYTYCDQAIFWGHRTNLIMCNSSYQEPLRFAKTVLARVTKDLVY